MYRTNQTGAPPDDPYTRFDNSSRKCWDSGGSCGAALRRAAMNGSLCAWHTTCSSYGGRELTRSIRRRMRFVWRKKEKERWLLLRDAPVGKNLRTVLHTRKARAGLKTTSFRWIPPRRSMVRQQAPYEFLSGSIVLLESVHYLLASRRAKYSSFSSRYPVSIT